MVHFLRDEDVIPFLRAIHERPDDDLPRLIFADWLDEHGDWRGPLLRGPAGDDRESTQAWLRWLGPELECVWVACRSGLLSINALPDLRLRGSLPARLAEALRQGWVRELSVTQHQFARLSAADLAEVPSLYIEQFVGVGWDVLQRLPQLRDLSLGSGSGLTDTAMPPVGSLTQLRKLRIFGSVRLTDATLEAVARLTNLERLSLDSCRGFTDAGLARLGSLVRLRRLDLPGCPLVSKAGVARLREAISGLDVQVKYPSIESLLNPPP